MLFSVFAFTLEICKRENNDICVFGCVGLLKSVGVVSCGYQRHLMPSQQPTPFRVTAGCTHARRAMRDQGETCPCAHEGHPGSHNHPTAASDGAHCVHARCESPPAPILRLSHRRALLIHARRTFVAKNLSTSTFNIHTNMIT